METYTVVVYVWSIDDYGYATVRPLKNRPFHFIVHAIRYAQEQVTHASTFPHIHGKGYPEATIFDIKSKRPVWSSRFVQASSSYWSIVDIFGNYIGEDVDPHFKASV